MGQVARDAYAGQANLAKWTPENEYEKLWEKCAQAVAERAVMEKEPLLQALRNQVQILDSQLSLATSELENSLNINERLTLEAIESNARAEKSEKAYAELEALAKACWFRIERSERLAVALQNIGGEHISDILEVRQLIREALQPYEKGKKKWI